MKKLTLALLLLGVMSQRLPHAEAGIYSTCLPPCCTDVVCIDGSFTVGAEWLYWKLDSEYVPAYALADFSPPGSTAATAVTQDRNVTYIDPDYESGYRVKLGYTFPSCGWEVDASYVYIPGHAKTGLVTPAEATETVQQRLQIPFFSSASINPFNAATPSFASEYQAHWNSNLAWFDLDIGRKLTFGECFGMRPHIGFRAAWGDQKYSGEANLVPTGLGITNATLSGILKQKFTGYGVEGGLWANWQLGCGFSLIGHVGGSILYSRYRLTSDVIQNSETVQGLPITPIRVSSDSTTKSGTPTMEYFVGLVYAYQFCDLVIDAHVGWEQHVFFNGTQLNFVNALGNLSAQGLTLGFDVTF